MISTIRVHKEASHKSEVENSAVLNIKGIYRNADAFSRGLRRSVVLALLPICLLTCRRGEDISVVEALAAVKDPVYKGTPVSPETRDEIVKILRLFKRNVEERIENVEELAVLYKNLALEYVKLDRIRQDILQKHIEIEGESLARAAGVPAAGEPGAGVAPPELPSGVLLGGGVSGMEGETLRLYYAYLGLGYLDKEIYAQALASFERALDIMPANELLYYYAGISAANLAKSQVQPERIASRNDLYRKAEAYYRRAIELDANYVEALYGLSVLLVYELDRPEEAEDHLERIAGVETRNSEALFLLAAVYYGQGRLEEAVELYKQIEGQSRIRSIRDQARRNREVLLEELYETR